MWFSEEQCIFSLFFIIGLITDFSELAEQYWFLMFSIADSDVIYFIVNTGWGPTRVVYGWVSDKLLAQKRSISRVDQMILFMIIPTICWYLISFMDGLDKHLTVILLTVSEFGPAIQFTILEAVMVQYIKRTEKEISPKCRRYQLIGKAVGGYAGSALLHITNVDTVFSVEFFLFLASQAWLVFVVRKVLNGYELLLDPIQTPDPITTTTTTTPIEEAPKWYGLFMVLVSSIPIARSAYQYFLLGPLRLTSNQFGLARLSMTLISLACTWSLEYTKAIHLKRFTWFTSVLFMLSCVLRFLQSTRILYEFDDFFLYLVHCVLYSLADSLLWTHYVATCTKAPMQGNEGAKFAQFMTTPSFGKLIRVSTDYALANGLNVNHDAFRALPTMFAVCYGMSLLPLLSSLFIY